MLIDNKQIAIVGGGPGGLTLARLLQLKGANVKVYERDANKDARLIGSPLDMHDDSGMAAIIKADLLDAFKKSYRPGADKQLVTNEKAEIFYSDHTTKPVENFGNKAFRPEIDRVPLRNMLLDSLQPNTVIWDSHFLTMDKDNDGWLLHFKNRQSVYADIVIAADGANSKIRPYITDIKAFYSGITMLEVNIPNAKQNAPDMYQKLDGGKIMAFGNAKCMLGGQKGNGEIGFYATLKIDENWAKNGGLDYSDKGQLLDWFKATFPKWSSDWYEIFENAATPVIPRPIYCMPLDQSWQSLSNLTMIGDAAHVMPPFAGEGANMAMRDALDLSEVLTSDQYATLLEAITDYETNMRKRAANAAKESLENGERMHNENSLGTMLAFFNSHQH